MEVFHNTEEARLVYRGKDRQHCETEGHTRGGREVTGKSKVTLGRKEGHTRNKTIKGRRDKGRTESHTEEARSHRENKATAGEKVTKEARSRRKTETANLG